MCPISLISLELAHDWHGASWAAHTQLEFQHRAKAEPSRPGPFCSGSRPRSWCFLLPSVPLHSSLSLSYLPPFLCHPLSVSGAEVVPGCLVLFILSASISLYPSLAPQPYSADRSSPTLCFRKSPQANPMLMAVERHSLALQGFIKPSDEWFLDLSLCILPKLNPGSDFPSLRHKDLKNFPGLKYLLKGWETVGDWAAMFMALREASSSEERVFLATP